MTNSEYFADDLGAIKNPGSRDFATQFVDLFPPYFREAASSSSGKYHAKWSNLPGGLRAHTKAVAYMVRSLAPAWSLTDDETDGALIAAVGHDAVKYGIPGGLHTSRTHEYEGACFFKKVVWKLLGDEGQLPRYQEIYNAIAWHQGRWSTTVGAPTFPEGFTRLEGIVHVADMTASRSEISFTFLQHNFIG